jgi:hypothetical protein
MRNRILSLSVALFLTSCASTSQNVDLLYSDTKLVIPGGFSLIGSKDMNGNMLAFRYGKVRGKDYISISNKTNDDSIDYGCAPVEFYNELFTPTGSTICHEKQLNLLRDEFLGNGAIKTWEAPNLTINYLDTSKNAGSFVFICHEDGNIIEINSDFLTENDYKKMLSDLLP